MAATPIQNQAVGARIAAAARSQYVAMLGVGDSNMILSTNYGHAVAVPTALANAGFVVAGSSPFAWDSTDGTTGASKGNVTGGFFTLAASPQFYYGWAPVLPTTSANGWASSVVALLTNAASMADGGTYDAWTENHRLPKIGGTYYRLLRPNYVDANGTVGTDGITASANSASNGITVPGTPAVANCMDGRNALVFDVWFGKESVTGGSFVPICVDNNSHLEASQVLKVWDRTDETTEASVVVDTGSAGTMYRASVYVPAATRAGTLNFALYRQTYGTLPTGEFYIGEGLVWDATVGHGIIWDVWGGVGSQGMYDFTKPFSSGDAYQVTEATIDHRIDVLVRPALNAGQDPMLVLYVCTAFNDPGETSPSIINGFAQPSTAGFIDDFTEWVRIWKSRWVRKGYKDNNLLILHVMDHARVPTYSGEITTQTYRDAVAAEMERRFPYNYCGLNMGYLVPYTEMLNDGGGLGKEHYWSEGAAKTIDAISASSGGLVTIHTNAVHGLTAGVDVVYLTATNSIPAVDGSFVVNTTPDTSTITIVLSGITISGTGGTLYPSTAVNGQLHLSIDSANRDADGYAFVCGKVFDAISSASPYVGLGASVVSGGGIRTRGR